MAKDNRGFRFATETEMKNATPGVAVQPSNLHDHPGMTKAWVAFNGAGTLAILDSYNISSVTDAGTGQYTPNMAVGMASTSFGTLCVSNQRSCNVRPDLVWTPSSMRVETRDSVGVLADADYVTVEFSGNQ